MLPGTAPLTAVQLLWVNLIMDTLGALALATEPSRRSVWSLYKQRDVAQRLRSGYLPVDCPLGIAVQGEGDSPP
jgi:magnesium-transporting ATPase (P-type)